jgi:Reverse transcriptase (RNA-dependent DNA polymerase)
MEFPQYFKKELSNGFDDPIIELNKSLYGGAPLAKHWFTKLFKGFTEHGLQQRALDNCLFIRSDMIIATYIDDCVHWYKHQDAMDAFVQSLKDDGDCYNWEHTVEGVVSAFLGIDIQHLAKHNHCKLSQTGLVDKILVATVNQLRAARTEKHLDLTRRGRQLIRNGTMPLSLDAPVP